MLGPRWLQPRIGPYIRRERDKREYFKLFTNDGYIGEPWRTMLLATARKVPADSLGQEMHGSGNKVVVFKNAVASNFERYFHEVKGHGPELYKAFRRITRKRYQPMPPTEPFVAIHVRLGDFSHFDAARAAVMTHNQRLPIEWYCDSLLALRQGVGASLPARVFSDGEDAELLPLLRLPDVTRANRAESVTHMLEMAQAKAIIGAGSNFNLWAAFFGQVPRIIYPKQEIVVVNEDPTRETSFHSNTVLPSTFLRHIEPAFARKKAS